MDAQSANSQDTGGGVNLAVLNKKLKGELRVSKKAEQIAKEKLVTTKKQLDKVQQELAKFKDESEERVSSLRQENSMLQLQIQKALAESAEILQKQSSSLSESLNSETLAKKEDGQKDQDVLKLVEEYSRQNELKSKEIEALNAKMSDKKTKTTQLKKDKTDLLSKLQRVESKLQNMSKFSHIFIKSIKQQNLSLRDQVEKQKQDFDQTFESTCSVIQQQISTRVAQSQQAMQALLTKEKENNASLQAQLVQVEKMQKEAFTGMSQEQTSHLQTNVEHLQAKCDKQKSKLSSIEEAHKDLNVKFDTLKVQYETEKTKNEITLVERTKEISSLKDQLMLQNQKEKNLVDKAEKVEQKLREEHSRIVEMYEGSGRYKDVRELYEAKLATKEQELMTAKESLLQAKLTDEQRVKDIERQTLDNEQRAKNLQLTNDTQSEKISELEDQLAALKSSHSTEIEALQTGIEEQLLQSMTIANSTQAQSESKFLAEKETLEAKVALLEKEITQSVRDCELKQADISEIERELEVSQEKVLELTNSQIQRIEVLQNNHLSQMATVETKYKEQIKSLEESHMKELINLDKVVQVEEKIVEVFKEHPKPEVSEKETQTDQVENNAPAPAIEAQVERQNVDNQLMESIQEPILGQKSTEMESVEMHEITSQETSYERSAQEGDVLEKVVEPKKQFEADLAMRGPRPGVRPMGRGMSQGRGMPRPAGLAPRGVRPNSTTPQQPRAPANAQRAARAQRPRGQGPRGLNQSQPVRPQSSPFGASVPVQSSPFPTQQEEEKDKPVTTDPFQQMTSLKEDENKDNFDDLMTQKSEPAADNTQQPENQTLPIEEVQKERELHSPIVEKEQEASPVKNSPPAQSPQMMDSPPKKKQALASLSDDDDDGGASKKANTSAAPLPQPGQTDQAAGNNRFMNMIGSLMGMITKRKQAYLGKPASAIRFDPDKGRYVIDGESESEEEIKAPPPKIGAKKKEPEEKPKEEQKKEVSGANAFTQVAFGGALRNKNRPSRGAAGARPGSSAPSRPVTQFGGATTPASQTAKEEEKAPEQTMPSPKPETSTSQPFATEQSMIETQNDTTLGDNSLYKSALEDSLNQTAVTAHDSFSQARPASTNSILGPDVELMRHEFAEQERKWEQASYKKDTLIQRLKAQISQLQKQVNSGNDSFKQTIESLEQFSVQLKTEGEAQQKEIQVLNEKLGQTSDRSAVAEFKRMQTLQDNQELKMEIQDLTINVKELRQITLDQKVELEIQKIEHNAASQNIKDSKESEQKRRILEEQNYQIESELEQLKWKMTGSEISKIELINARDLAQNESVSLQQQLAQAQTTIESAKQDLAWQNQEISTKNKDIMIQIEKEKQNLKEHCTKLQSEKQRLSEQVAERQADFDRQVQQMKTEKRKSQEEFQKILRDKEHHLTAKIEQILTENQAKVQNLEEKIQTQATEMQRQTQKRQRDHQNSEKQVKTQLDSLQSMLMGKDETLTNLQSQNEEQTNELALHTEIREKLNDHIIYLQNEVRKRDELLEGGSEFGGDDDFAQESDSASVQEEMSSSRNLMNGGTDSGSQAKSVTLQRAPSTKRRTMGQILKSQLEETRQTLKASIEEKLRSEKQAQNFEQKLSKLTEGVKEISTIADQQLAATQVEPSEDTQSASETSDQIIHLVISKFFKLQHANQNKLMELQHEIDVGRLQADDAANVKFDLEILTQEKQWQDQEIESLNTQLATMNENFTEQQTRFDTMLAESTAELQQAHQRAITELKTELNIEHERLIQDTRREVSSKTAEEQAQFELEISFKDAEIRKLQQASESLKNDHDRSLEELVQAQSSTQKQESRIKTLEVQLKEAQDDLEESQAQFQEATHSLQRSQLATQGKEQELKQQLDEATKQVKLEQNNASMLRYEIVAKDDTITKMSQDTDQLVNQFLEKKEQYKQQLKSQKQKMIDELTRMDQANSEEVESLKQETQDLQEQLAAKDAELQSTRHLAHSANESTQESVTSEMADLMKAQLATLKKKHSDKESKYKEALDELLASNEKLLQERDSMREELDSVLREIEQLQATIERNQVYTAELEAKLKANEQSQETKGQSDEPQEVSQADSGLSQAQLDQMTAEIAEFKEKSKAKRSELQKIIASMQEELEISQSEKAEVEQNLESVKSKLEKAHIELELQQVNSQTAQLVDEQEEKLQLAIQAIEKLKAKKDAKEEKLKDVIQKMKDEIVELNQALTEECEKNNQQVKPTDDGSDEKLEELQAQIEQQSEQISELAKARDELNESVTQAKVSSEDQESTVSELKKQLEETQASNKVQSDKLEQELQSSQKTLEEVQEENEQIKSQLETCKNELEIQMASQGEQSNQYQQEFSELLKKKQASWKEKTAKIKSDFKELLTEHQSLVTKYDDETTAATKKIEEYEQTLESMSKDKTDLAESLDLTKVQYKDEISKFEDEKSMLLAEHTERVSAQAVQLTEFMKETGVEIDGADGKDFSNLIEACKVAFQNYQENKTALQQLIDEREEIAREKEDMGFELERANAELNLIKLQFEKSEAGKLHQQVQVLQEESSEMKNDFIIKFSSYNEEIESLKGKLSMYENNDDDDDDSQGSATKKIETSDLARNPNALETTRDYRSKYNLEDTLDSSRINQDTNGANDPSGANQGGLGAFMASLFLTESEMKGPNVKE